MSQLAQLSSPENALQLPQVTRIPDEEADTDTGIQAVHSDLLGLSLRLIGLSQFLHLKQSLISDSILHIVWI